MANDIWKKESKSKHLFPKRDACFLFLLSHTEGVLQNKDGCSLNFFIIISFSQMRTSPYLVIVAIEVGIIRLVRVRAYRRVRFGKVERVRSHYRRL